MDRKMFIRELEFLLQDIDDVERDEALQYYEDYFTEAGVENEQQVINDLGSPESVAAIIKAGLENQFDQDIEYGESKMGNANYKQNQEIIKTVIEENEGKEKTECKKHFNGNPDRNKILSLVIIISAIFILLPIEGSILGLGFGFFAAVLSIGLVILFGGFACLVGAIICLVKALTIITAYPGAGLITLSGCLGLIALTFIFFVLAKYLIKSVPIIIKVIVDLCRKLVYKVGEY